MTTTLLADLAGKAVVVTGASAGIGAAVARTFAREGARVALVGRNAERLAGVAADIRGEGGTAEAIQADLAAGGSALVIERTLDLFGAIDVLVHNAGIVRDIGPFEDASMEGVDEQWLTNVRAPMELSRLALPHLKPGSSMVFVGSNVNACGFPMTAAYSATKGALEAFARCIAIELAPRGIRINSVAPGMTRTAMMSRLDEDPELERQAIEATPAGCLGDPQDIANAVVFLASESASRYILGETLVVDGGFTAV